MASSVIKNVKSEINYVDNMKYARGNYRASGNTIQEAVTTFIQNLDTENKNTVFDMTVFQYGIHHFHGYVYANKDYGSGIFTDFQGNTVFWKRNNNVDAFYNITKTQI